MLKTYKAVITKDQIQWQDETPAIDNPSSVIITFLDSASALADEARALKMGEALCDIAARGGLSGVDDASQWQREQRQDRLLPGRES